MVDVSVVIRYLSWFLLAASMFVAGLYLRPRELGAALKQYSLLGRAVLANSVVVPLIGLGLYFITPMSADIGVAFLLVTFSFGVPLAVNFIKTIRADVPFATVLVFALAAVTSITMPILLYFFLPVSFSVVKSFLAIILFVTLFQLLPLILGLALGDSQTVRRKILRPLAIITAACGIFLIGLVIIIGLALIAFVGIWPILAMITLTLVSLGVGWVFGGPKLINREVLAINTALRNFPICFLLATTIFIDTKTEVGIAIFASIMLLSVFGFSRLISHYQPPKKETPSLSESTKQRQV